MEAYRILVKGIVKKEDRFLIVQKWCDDNISEPFQWNFIDGEETFGEDPQESVVRLVQEGTGLNVSVNRVLYTWSFMMGSVCNIGLAYLCDLDMEESIQLSEELSDYKWIKREDMDTYLTNTQMLNDLKNINLE